MDDEDYYLYLKGKAEFDKKCYETAISYFECSNLIAEHFKYYEMLYCCWMQLGDTRKAFASIEKAYQINPQNDKTAFEYAVMLAESGNYETAQTVLASIIQRNPTYKKAVALAASIKQNVES